MRKILLICLLVMTTGWSLAQPSKGQVEVFCGADLSYRDINFIRLYDVLLNLTPGVKWHLGQEWQVAGQAQVPAINNGYGKQYMALGMANVSKQLHLEGQQHLKLTGGLFSKGRYGLDVRWMYPATSWLLFHAQAGITDGWVLTAHDARWAGDDWRWTGQVGANVWLAPWDTEFRLTGGRYLNECYGGQIDVMRHFPHCTVGVYYQQHERDKSNYRANRHVGGGFKVIVMLPPYKHSDKRLVVRPASNFRLTYNAQADGESMKMYVTDPEENERDYPVRIPWGTGAF